MEITEFLKPALALVLWTFVMWFWLYFTRIPAMQKAKIDPQQASSPTVGDWKSKMPANVTSIADNYNHLHEQPVLFYALMAIAAISGGADMIAYYLAWGYVALRVVHSLIQATVNIVMIRFSVFSLASLVLMALGVKEALRIFF
ncbi:MAG: MAPEG family protein [Pseudomonadota bacterium]